MQGRRLRGLGSLMVSGRVSEVSRVAQVVSGRGLRGSIQSIVEIFCSKSLTIGVCQLEVTNWGTVTTGRIFQLSNKVAHNSPIQSVIIKWVKSNPQVEFNFY